MSNNSSSTLARYSAVSLSHSCVGSICMCRSIRRAGAFFFNRRSWLETEIGHHGAEHHHTGDNERGQHAGPKAHTIERHKQRTLPHCDVVAEFFRKGSANGDGEDKSAGPHNRDPNSQLKSLREDSHGFST